MYASRVKSIRDCLVGDGFKAKTETVSSAAEEAAFGIGKGFAAGGAAIGKCELVRHFQ